MTLRRIDVFAVAFFLVAVSLGGLTTSMLTQPALAYGGSISSDHTGYYGYQNVVLSCTYGAYWKSGSYDPTGMCEVDNSYFYFGYNPSGGTTKTYAPFSFGPGTHTLTLWYAIGWDRSYQGYVYATLTSQFSMTCIQMNPVSVSGGYYYGWTVYNKDYNQDCKVDSVVIDNPKALITWPWGAVTDSYTNVFRVEFTGFMTNGNTVNTNQLPASALDFQVSPSYGTPGGYQTKTVGWFVNLARPPGSQIQDSGGHKHKVTQYTFNHVAPNEVWAGDPANPQRGTELYNDLQTLSPNPNFVSSWTPGNFNFVYWVTLDVRTPGSGVAFQGQFAFYRLARGYSFYYITSDSNWGQCWSDVWAVDIP